MLVYGSHVRRIIWYNNIKLLHGSHLRLADFSLADSGRGVLVSVLLLGLVDHLLQLIPLLLYLVAYRIQAGGLLLPARQCKTPTHSRPLEQTGQPLPDVGELLPRDGGPREAVDPADHGNVGDGVTAPVRSYDVVTRGEAVVEDPDEALRLTYVALDSVGDDFLCVEEVTCLAHPVGAVSAGYSIYNAFGVWQ